MVLEAKNVDLDGALRRRQERYDEKTQDEVDILQNLTGLTSIIDLDSITAQKKTSRPQSRQKQPAKKDKARPQDVDDMALVSESDSEDVEPQLGVRYARVSVPRHKPVPVVRQINETGAVQSVATMRKTLGPTVRFTASGAGYDTTRLARTRTELVDVIGKDNKIIQKTITVR